MVLPLALALSMVTTPAVQDTTVGTVYGSVRSTSGVPVIGALVEVLYVGRQLFALTDSAGNYILRRVPAGRRIIRVSHPDHEANNIGVLVSAGRRAQVGFGLIHRPLFQLDPVRVETRVSSTRDTLPLTRAGVPASVARAGIEASPGVGEFGLAQAAREVPGHEPPDPSDMLLVRGGSADLNLIILNGAPVVAPFHIGGLIQALPTDLLRSATFHLGGAPARYDGGLSYIMDVETRPGDSTRPVANVAFDLLAARTVVEGPVGNGGSYLLGARAIHGLATPFVTDPFPYAYGDILGRFDLAVSDSGRLSVSGFWNRENLRLDRADDIDQVAEWGNGAGSLRYRAYVSGLDVVLTGALSRFRTSLPLIGPTPLITSATSRRARLAADATAGMGQGSLAFGVSLDRLRINQHARLVDDPSGVSERRRGEAGDVSGAYLESRVVAGPYVRLRSGLRADLYSVDRAVRLAPRVAISFLLGQSGTLSFSGGRFSQYTLAPIALGGSESDNVADTDAFTVASAWHGVGSLDLDLGEGVGFGLEGFYKSFDDLPTESGEADAAGVDLWLRRFGARLQGWIGYSLGWVWTTAEGSSQSARVSDGRHLVSVGVQGPFLEAGSFEITVAYGAGLPYTAIPEPDLTTPVFSVASVTTTASRAAEPAPPLPTEPADPYLRLDARISHTWQGTWRSMSFQVTPYIKILNALDRRDALFYHFDRAANAPEPRPLAPLPVLPLIGVEWRF